jgi:hypothetical protein
MNDLTNLPVTARAEALRNAPAGWYVYHKTLLSLGEDILHDRDIKRMGAEILSLAGYEKANKTGSSSYYYYDFHKERRILFLFQMQSKGQTVYLAQRIQP